MDINAKAFVHKAYTLPFKLRDRVSRELDLLYKIGIMERIEYSEWASPIVVVPKTNNDLRICADYSKTINRFIETNHYPIPVIDEVLSKFHGCVYFCVLDLKGAYQLYDSLL